MLIFLEWNAGRGADLLRLLQRPPGGFGWIEGSFDLPLNVAQPRKILLNLLAIPAAGSPLHLSGLIQDEVDDTSPTGRCPLGRGGGGVVKEPIKSRSGIDLR